MRARLRKSLFILLTVLWILALSAHETQAKGPKGGGGGRGGEKSHASFGGGKHSGGSSSGSMKSSGFSKGGASHQSVDRYRGPASESNGGDTSPWSKQRMNEERKLNHRFGVADHLDGIAERNGNSNLQGVAERKREKARQLYEKRMAKIEGKAPSPEADDESPNLPEPSAGLTDTDEGTGESAAPGPNDNPPPASQKLTGRENALSRQLQNEQRKLARQMEMAERLWDAYEQTGDEQLADAAQALEDRALAQYEKRMNAIRGFQDRHGLPDMIGNSLEPDSPLPGSLGEPINTLGEMAAPLLEVPH